MFTVKRTGVPAGRSSAKVGPSAIARPALSSSVSRSAKALKRNVRSVTFAGAAENVPVLPTSASMAPTQ